MSETQSITLRDGRTLCYGVYGSSSLSASLTIFYFHGFPASHHEASVLDAAARALDIRIVAPDRPGMNGSTFQPDRAITDWPADVLELADHESVRASTFAVLGTSGGAPYALACCAAIPESRLLCAGVVSGLYPASLGTAGMLMGPRVMLWLAPRAPALVEKIMEWGFVSALRDDGDGGTGGKPEKLLGDMMKGRPAPDKKVWEDDEGGVREMLITSVRGALVNGSAKGAAWEARLFGSPWRFALGDIRMGPGKLVLWHGDQDVNTPLAMAREAHKQLEGSELVVEAGEGHVSLLIHRVARVLEELKVRAGINTSNMEDLGTVT